VKVNLFTPEPDLAGMIDPESLEVPRVASLPELFRSKALAAANRSLSRDWVDLYVLFQKHGFTVVDLEAAFRHESIREPEARLDRAFDNLCRGAASARDPGYEMLMPDAPSLETMAEYFRAMRDAYQIEKSKRAFEN
jgi:hypothetical protein